MTVTMINTDPDLVNTLDQLKYLHFPEDNLWWPPAPAIILILLLVTITFGALIKALIKKIYLSYQLKPVKLALKQLKEIKTYYIGTIDTNNINTNNKISHELITIQKINILLKKCAILQFSNNSHYSNKKKNQHNNINIESLSGNDWLVFLNSTGKTNLFTQDEGQILNLAYQNIFFSDQDLQNNIVKLIALTEQWIKKIFR